MEKILTLLRRPTGADVAAFSAGCLAEAKRRIDAKGLRRCIVNVADAAASEVAHDAHRPPPAWDGAVETWWDAPRIETEPGAAEPLLAALGKLGTCLSYRVREVVQKEYVRDWAVGERSPGIKGVFTVNRRSDLTREQFAQHWRDGHGPLALQRHVGLWKYVQNVSLGALTPGAPDFDGFATLHFRTAYDMRERFYDSAEGRRLIAEDVGRFIGSPSMQVNCSEYVLKA